MPDELSVCVGSITVDVIPKHPEFRKTDKDPEYLQVLEVMSTKGIIKEDVRGERFVDLPLKDVKNSSKTLLRS